MADERSLRERLEWLAEHYLMTREERAWLQEANYARETAVKALHSAVERERDEAVRVRDLAREASSRDLEAKRAAEATVKAVSEQLEFDRTRIAEFAVAVKKVLDSRFWLTEGRGSYEWDDDRFRQEFTETYNEIKAALCPLFRIAANWNGCPKTAQEVAQARIDLKRRIAELERAHADRVEELKVTAERYQEAVKEMHKQRELQEVTDRSAIAQSQSWQYRVRGLEQRAEAAEARERALREALDSLVKRLDAVHADEAYKSVWVFYMVHGFTYSGPTYTDALESARAALAPTPAPAAAQEPDTRRLDWWETHLNHQHGTDYETGEIIIYRVTGNINDREWHEVSRADTLRAALDAAAQEPKP